MGIGKNKKRQIHADFKTVKHKLGKKLKSATRTDLSFKTLTIFVPQQSVAAEKEPFVTHRHLSLDDLLKQLKHHNHSVRKDAVIGLKSLFTTWPFLLEQNLPKIFECTAELVLDADAVVRGNLRMLLKRLFILSELALAPFFPVFVAYVSVAMTHADFAVQLDAVLFIDLWQQAFPRLVSQHAHKLLPHYIVLLRLQNVDEHVTLGNSTQRLNVETERVKGRADQTSSKGKPFHLRMALLASLYQILFFRFGHVHHESEFELNSAVLLSKVRPAVFTTSWVRSSRGGIELHRPRTEERHHQTCCTLFESAVGVLNSFENVCIEYTNIQNSDQFPDERRLRLDSVLNFKYFFILLFPPLIFAWLESNPRHLTVQHVGHATNVAGILDILLSHLSSSRSSERQEVRASTLLPSKDRDLIIRHIVDAFPVECVNCVTAEDRMGVVKLNVRIARIASYFCKTDGCREEEEGMVEFVVRILDQSYLNEEKDLDARKKIEEVYFEVASDVLCVLNRLLNTVDLNTRIRLLKAFWQFGRACSLKSRAKRGAILFLSELLDSGFFQEECEQKKDETILDRNDQKKNETILKKSDHNKDETILKKSDQNKDETILKKSDQNKDETILKKNDHNKDEIISNDRMEHKKVVDTFSKLTCSLIIFLTKTLWELKDSNPRFSHDTLKVLRKCSTRTSEMPNSVYAQVLQKAMVPLFWTRINKSSIRGRGADNPPTEHVKEVYGPFLSMSVDTQRAAIETLYYLKNLSPALVESLVHCLSVSRTSFETVEYALETLDFSRHFNESLADYLSFLLSVLANNGSMPVRPDFETTRRRFKLAQLIAYLASQLNLRDELFELIDTHLLEMLQRDDSHDLIRVVLTFIGSYMVLNRPVTSPAEQCTPSPMINELPKRVLSFLSSTFPNSHHGRHPELIYVKDILTDISLFQSFLQHWQNSIQTPSDFDLVTLSDLITNYSVELHDSLQRSERAVRLILAQLKTICHSTSSLESEIDVFYLI